LSDERRRTKCDTYADVIEIFAGKGLCSLTRVSHGANMPMDRTKKELQLLVSRGFINEVAENDAKKYRATKWAGVLRNVQANRKILHSTRMIDYD